MERIPKFDGDFLECEGGFYLVKKGVLELYFERMAKMQREIEKLNEKKPSSRRTVLDAKKGRKKVLEIQDKITAWELHKKGYSLREIGEVMKVSHETIRQAVFEVEKVSEEQQQKASENVTKEIPKSNVFGTQISSDFRVRDGAPKVSENPLE